MIIPLPVLSDSPAFAAIELNKSNYAIGDMVDVAKAEFDMIQEMRKNPDKYPHAVDVEYQYFKDELEGMDTFNSADFIEKITAKIDNRVVETLNQLESLGLVEKAQNDKYKWTDLFEFTNTPEVFVRDFIEQYMAAHPQLMSLTVGHPVFYKSMGDYYKRAKEIWSPGTLGNPHAQRTDS